MGKTKIEWVKNPDGSPGYTMIDERYIAGFFDGEGSAMVLTIKRHWKGGVIYRLRPVIKISQKSDGILWQIWELIRYGHVDCYKKQYTYVINGLAGVIHFCHLIGPHTIVKKQALRALGELVQFQQAHIRNIPYTYEETVRMLDWRDQVFFCNEATRTNLKQKYPKAQILAETDFVNNMRTWQLARCEKGTLALIEAGKPYRFKKGERHAPQQNRMGTKS